MKRLIDDTPATTYTAMGTIFREADPSTGEVRHPGERRLLFNQVGDGECEALFAVVESR